MLIMFFIGLATGLNFSTAIQVTLSLALVSFVVYGWSWLGEDIKPKYVPMIIVAYLACGLPAYDYWAFGEVSSSLYPLRLVMKATPWYANGWIQLGIAVGVLVVGFFVTRNSNQY